ncbi:MAG: DNA polymerase III subunit gamma/tau [Bdellovibrionaceae bacterium]|nr:DNA polymerase III subunit gamma/tau [Pseudobdellovibrionaceae bacterium]
MSYEVIARKWRPQSFDEIVGQSHITQTLTNSLRNNRLPHAILLTGPRGTGKTSSARILAKSIRCENAVNFVPCNKCSSCLEIAQGHNINVIEIDGASNNGVDAIRELRETVGYRPSSGKYKIYIIDEVHMLSTSAFNALLKTLEEPPEHVVFMMATTDAHKIPQTILSRCQRFDFRKIPTRQISEHLEKICISLQVQADLKALWLIARQGDGSMRDAQSLLDQVISFSGGDALSATKVTDILGLTDREVLNETLDGLANRNPGKILNVIAKLGQTGVEPKLFCEDLLELLRHLILLKAAGGQGNVFIDLPDSELAFLAELSPAASEEDFHLLFDMLLKGIQDVIRSTSSQIVLEVVLLRMAAAPRIIDLEELRLQGPQEKQPAGVRVGAGDSLKPSNALAPIETRRPIVSAVAAPRPKKYLEASAPQEKWLLFVNTIRASDGFFAAKIENLLFQGVDNKIIHLGIPTKLAFLREQMADHDLRKRLQGFIDSYWGEGYSFKDSVVVKETSNAESAITLNQKKNQVAEEQIHAQIEKLPQIQAAKQIFKGIIKTHKEKELS